MPRSARSAIEALQKKGHNKYKKSIKSEMSLDEVCMESPMGHPNSSFYRPRNRGDNTFGSIHPSVCLGL